VRAPQKSRVEESPFIFRSCVFPLCHSRLLVRTFFWCNYKSAGWSPLNYYLRGHISQFLCIHKLFLALLFSFSGGIFPLVPPTVTLLIGPVISFYTSFSQIICFPRQMPHYPQWLQSILELPNSYLNPIFLKKQPSNIATSDHPHSTIHSHQLPITLSSIIYCSFYPICSLFAYL